MNGTANSVPLPGIEHVVVVMFENRSFDNMLGGLYPDLTAAGTYDGVTTGMYNPTDPYGHVLGEINAWQGNEDITIKTMPYPDPGELFSDMNVQIFAPNDPPATGAGNPTMRGFVYNYANQTVPSGSPTPRPADVMQFYGPGSTGNLPVMTALAKAYAVSDAWFASGPVQTLVNRIFVHSAQPSTYTDPSGQTANCTDNSTVTNNAIDPNGNVDVPTVFELLDNTLGSGQINWKVYYNDFPLSALIKYVDDNWAVIDPNSNVFSYASEIYDDFASDV